MSENISMRQYMDVVGTKQSTDLNEGIIDSIRNWINGLSDPIKKQGIQNIKDLENRLKTKYGNMVPDQVKSSNKSWMWSKITYKDLYDFSIKILGASPEDLDRSLKNKVVVNNLKQVIRSLPAGVDAPTLPITGKNIQNNTTVISPTIDKQTKQYVSKAIAIAILDGLAYIEQQKQDEKTARSAAPAATDAATTAATTGVEPRSTEPAGTPSTPDDIKAAILAIKQGLASMKGAA